MPETDLRPTEEVPDGQSHHVVVLGANSAVWFPDEPVPMAIHDFRTDSGPVRLIFRTRHSDEGFEVPVPRELWVEVSGNTASDLNDAIEHYAAAAHALLGFVALSANAAVQDPEVKLAYDNSAGRTRREYFAQFVPEERGPPLPGRFIDTTATVRILECFDNHPEFDRLIRAVEQYRIALLHWRPGREILALAHLFMGMDALTKVALRRELEAAALNDPEAYAERLGVELRELDGDVRRRILFQGDAETASSAKRASDGFEHGFLAANVIRPLATGARDLTARYLRAAILDLAGASEELRSTLTNPPFRDPFNPWVVRYMRGHLLGEADALAAEGQEYPIFLWRSKLTGHGRNEDGSYAVEVAENLQASFNPALRFERRSYEMWGSLDGMGRRPQFTVEPEHHIYAPEPAESEEPPPEREE
jgi:hypothetical protein